MLGKLYRHFLRVINRVFGTQWGRGRSETGKVRARLQGYCTGDGIDVGYGGDPICPSAIAMDLPEPYAHYRDFPQHLHGRAESLHWFRDGVLNYVYSSHVLEDFEDTRAVLLEWWRVLKPGGHLILFLPDEQRYREHCRQQGKPPNAHHIHEHFGRQHVLEAMQGLDYEVVHEQFPSEVYSFELVLRRRPAS